MKDQKIKVNYIYSKDCDTANYLRYLIDKVRGIEEVDFKLTCLEDFGASPAKLKQMDVELSEFVKLQEFDKASDLRNIIISYKLAAKYSDIAPVFILKDGEEELVVSGTRKALSMILELTTRVTEAASFLHKIDIEGMSKAVVNMIDVVVSNKNKAVEKLDKNV